MSDPKPQEQIESNSNTVLLANELKHQLQIAAELLRSDYADQKELTLFTTLDSEDFRDVEDDC
jgi:hypothetical protein